jgi:hypothetical protein
MHTQAEKAAMRAKLIEACQKRFGQLSENWLDEEIIDFILAVLEEESDHEERIRQLEAAVWPTQGRP